MSESAGTFFIELSSLFNPKGFETADKKIKESSASFNGYFNNLNSRSESWANSFSSAAGNVSLLSRGQMSAFFDFTSDNFLNLQSLTEGVFSNILNSFVNTLTEMAAQSALSGIFSFFSGGGGFLSGLLGSRRSGGPISQTGPYLLHEGEFVLPPELVKAIKENKTPSQSSFNSSSVSSGANFNITVNAPVNISGGASSKTDARLIAEEISSAARRGVSWAVEQAKINYKIGMQKSGESSL